MYSSWSGSKSAQYEDSSDALIDCGTDTTLPDQPDQEQGERGQEGAEGGHDGVQGTHNDSQQEVEADQFPVSSWRIICIFLTMLNLDQLA